LKKQLNKVSVLSQGFTLIELLVVISIISLLSSVVYAALNMARENARMVASMQFDANILHGIGDQLVGEWKFDEGSGTAMDTSNFGNNGTVNGPIWNATAGYNGKGTYYFNGNQSITTPVKNINTTNTITFTAWVKGYASGGLTGIADFPNRDTGIIANPTGNELRFMWNNGYYDKSTGLNMPTDRWNFVAMSVTPTQVTMYMNNNSVKIAGGFSPVDFTVGNFSIGYYKYPNSWVGYVDNVRIYTAPITSAQIQQLYAEGLKTHQDLALKQ
jgi:prepilin-type N-terminal cleavage/methylation domain-containing protein